MTRWCALVAGLAMITSAGVAEAQRPVLTGELTHGATADVLIHYTTTGVDAVPAADANTDGVPDFVATVDGETTAALGMLVGLGFRRPVPDGALGGDGRIDIYLRNLQAADGNTSVDGCTGGRCTGYIVAENDYAGFGYPTVLEGIRSVVPHELFHLIQNAYASGQPSTWTEGSAVWAVERLYGNQNGDFERFLSAFLGKSFRPFERAISGFSDLYAYGASLWPYFLGHRYDDALIVATWTACEQADFLPATSTALGPYGSTFDDAWIEFTRWNAFTGKHAAGGGYPDATKWPEVPYEPALAGRATIYVEGLSARYVPFVIAERSSVAVAAPGAIKVAAWAVPDGGGLADGIELASATGPIAATLEAGSYRLVVTGLSRNTITTAVDVTVGPAPEKTDDDGGCSASHASPSWLVVALLGLFGRRRGHSGRRGRAS